MGAHIEWIAGMMRAGDTVAVRMEWVLGILRMGDAFRVYGDPFDASCFALRLGNAVLFLGVGTTARRQIETHRDELIGLLSPLGVTRMEVLEDIAPGDEFYDLFCCALRLGDTVRFMGASAHANVAITRQRDGLRRIFEPLEIERVEWERRKPGKRKKYVSVPVTKREAA